MHTHECGGCSKGCDRHGKPQDQPGEIPLSRVKSVIGVMSGKGGVGKSLITALLAAKLTQMGKQTAILDADILNPTIPALFGLRDRAISSDLGLYPAITPGGVKIMSLALLMESDTDPVIWPGPIQAKAALQFWTDVIWDEVDHMLIDFPSGTGDVPQRLLEDIPINGVFIVSAPGALSQTATDRVSAMAQSYSVPILGRIENFSDHIPRDPRLEEAADQGRIEALDHPYLANVAAACCG